MSEEDITEAGYRCTDVMPGGDKAQDSISRVMGLIATCRSEWKSEWISVGDRLPNCGELALVASCDDVDIGACIHNGSWLCPAGLPMYDVTHWMPLPEPPNE